VGGKDKCQAYITQILKHLFKYHNPKWKPPQVLQTRQRRGGRENKTPSEMKANEKV